MAALPVDVPMPPPPPSRVPHPQARSKKEARPKLEVPSQPSGVDTRAHPGPVPTPPPAPASSSTSPLLDLTKIEESIEVPGFGRKGEGKNANYGVQVPEPQVVPVSELPPEARTLLERPPGLDTEPTSEIPPPIAATTEVVEEWIREGLTQLVNLSGKIPPEVGESILWRGVKKGKSGGPSTKEEHFHGRVRHVSVENDEIFVFLD